jgi:hypothetical protein
MTDAVNVFSVTVACDNTVDLPSALPARQSPKVAGQRKYIQVFGTADSGFRTVLDLKTGINRTRRWAFSSIPHSRLPSSAWFPRSGPRKAECCEDFRR